MRLLEWPSGKIFKLKGPPEPGRLGVPQKVYQGSILPGKGFITGGPTKFGSSVVFCPHHLGNNFEGVLFWNKKPGFFAPGVNLF